MKPTNSDYCACITRARVWLAYDTRYPHTGMDITNWNRWQRVVFLVAAAFVAVLIFGGHARWDSRQRDTLEEHQQFVALSSRTFRLAERGGYRDLEYRALESWGRANEAAMHHAAEYHRRRSIYRPLAIGTSGLAIPFLMLLVSWRWAKSRPRSTGS